MNYVQTDDHFHVQSTGWSTLRRLKRDADRRTLWAFFFFFSSSIQPRAPLKLAACKAFEFVLESVSDDWKLLVQMLFRNGERGLERREGTGREGEKALTREANSLMSKLFLLLDKPAIFPSILALQRLWLARWVCPGPDSLTSEKGAAKGISSRPGFHRKILSSSSPICQETCWIVVKCGETPNINSPFFAWYYWL